MTSIGGLPDPDDDDDCGVSKLWVGAAMSTSGSSTLLFTLSARALGAALLAGPLVLGEGETGEEDASSIRGALRRFIVTMLDEASVAGSCETHRCSGVWGVMGSWWIFAAGASSERRGSPSRVEDLEDSLIGLTVSWEAPGEPEREVRRRFREEMSPSSKGLGRVELGSAESARSGWSRGLETRSIGVVQDGGRRARSVEVQRRHTVARDAPATAAQN